MKHNHPIWLLLTIILLIGVPRLGQAQCPPDTSMCIDNGGTYTAWDFYGDCKITVQFKWACCTDANGQPYLRFENLGVTLTGDCSFYKDSTIQQLAELLALSHVNWLAQNNPQWCDPDYTVPICPNKIQQVEFVSTACYIWQKCTYVTTSAPPVCVPPENNPGPAPGNTVDVWSWHDCGTACCRRVYNICFDGGVTSTGNPTDLGPIHISVVSKTKTGACSLQTSWPSKPCNDGC